MIKNSTIIIAACLIMVGIISNSVIENVAARKSIKDKILIEKEIKSLKLNEQLLKTKPLMFQVNGSELIYLPEISFQRDNMNIDYSFYKYENDALVKIPFHK